MGMAYGVTLAVGPTWANRARDSGELITAAAVSGVAHPSGYPTYLLFLQLFQLLPLGGDLAFRSHLSSACAGVITTILVYLLLAKLLHDPASPTVTTTTRWLVVATATVSAAWFGLSPLFWSQAVVAEVYALHTMFVALLLLWLLDDLQSPANHTPRSSHRWWRGPVVGLMLGNHLTILPLVLVWMLWPTIPLRSGGLVRTGQRLVGLLVGLLVYGVIPFRAAQQPPINWGGASDLAGFWWLLSGAPYRELAFGLPAQFLLERLQAWASLLLQQFGLVGLVLGGVGLVFARPPQRRFIWLSAALALCWSLFAVGYNTADSWAYLLPVFLIFALWIGSGLLIVLENLAARHPLLAPGVLLGVVIFIGWQVSATLPLVDASTDQRAVVYGRSVLQVAPPNALVVTSEDRDSFVLWYYHFALAERRDVAIVVEPLLDFAWYRTNLTSVYPTLTLPADPAEVGVTGWSAALQAANAPERPFCRTNLATLDDPDAMVLVCDR